MIITITQAQIDQMTSLRGPNYRKDLETILIRQANSKIQIDTNTKAYSKLQRKYQTTCQNVVTLGRPADEKPTVPHQNRPENETKHCRNNSTNPDNWCDSYTGNHCEKQFPKGKCLCGWQKWLKNGPCPTGKF